MIVWGCWLWTFVHYLVRGFSFHCFIVFLLFFHWKSTTLPDISLDVYSCWDTLLKFLFYINSICQVVIPRYGDYADCQDTGVRKRYKVDGQVNNSNFILEYSPFSCYVWTEFSILFTGYGSIIFPNIYWWRGFCIYWRPNVSPSWERNIWRK